MNPRPLIAAGLAAVMLLTGCSVLITFAQESIEAPLVADGQTNVQDGVYEAWGKTLRVNDSTVIPLKFSLATLPSGTTPTLSVEGDAVTPGTLEYSLTSAKVTKARLVFLVSKVNRPGYLAVDAAFASQGDCYEQESVAPACGDTVAMSEPARDSDVTEKVPLGQALLISHGGFHSVDVTDLVKSRITQGSIVLQVRAVPHPADGGFADFEFDSKDQDRFGGIVQGARLLITLSDAQGTLDNENGFSSGSRFNMFRSYNMRRDAADPAVADSLFENANPHWVQDAQSGNGAFFSFPSAQYGGADLNWIKGGLAVKEKVSMGVKLTGLLELTEPVASSTPQPALQWHSVFRDMSTKPKWVNWSENPADTTPPSGTPAASTALPIGQNSARVIADTSMAWVQQTLQNLPLSEADAKKFYSVYAITSNTQQVLKVSNAYSSRPRFITAITPKPTNPLIEAFLLKDAEPAESLWCVGPWSNNVSCMPSNSNSYSVKTRIGKSFSYHQVIPYIQQGSTLPMKSALNLWTPPQSEGQATAILDRDQANLNARSFVDGGFNSLSGYLVQMGTANRVVGKYAGYITLPGRNAPLVLNYENLPLPAPSLSGPQHPILPLLPSGTSAPEPQQLAYNFMVDDSVAQLDDDTIYWDFASSTAGDVTPGTNIKQGDGKRQVSFGFGGPGPRRLSVTSRGDSSATASLDVMVSAQTATVLSSSVPSPVYGQGIQLLADVRSSYGVPGGSVAVAKDGAPLGSGPLDGMGRSTLALGLLPAGTHAFTAGYEGNASTGFLPSTSSAVTLTVAQAQSQTELTPPSTFTPGVPLEVQVQVSALAPSMVTPEGEVQVQGAGGSCSAVLSQGVGTCTLTPVLGRAQHFTATYAGDDNIAASSASLEVRGHSVVVPIPTLRQWVLMLLSVVLAGLAVQRLRGMGGRR